MSYDYSLFKAPGSGPMESWPAEQPESLGSIDEIKKALSVLFPDVSWERSNETWFGRWENGDRYAEFQMTPEHDGKVRFITMRRTERKDVEALCRQLGVVAIDPQSMELYSSLTCCWSRT